MQWKLTGRLMTAAILSLAAGCQAGPDDANTNPEIANQEAKAESSCVQRFDGVSHCALGKASVTASEKGVLVQGLASAKSDGVSSNFAKAVRWSQTSQVRLEGDQAALTLAARSGDQVVSSLQVLQGKTKGEAVLKPSFTGGPGGSGYIMNVYHNGTLTGSTSQPAGMVITFTNWRDFLKWMALQTDFYQFDVDFHSISNHGKGAIGACAWSVKTAEQPFTVNIDGKDIVGDEVEFIETIALGAYPYQSFTGIDVRGSAGDMNITSEYVTAAR
ncbi:hypothetical protein JGU66_22330 [Myxococcaceae bacterium JPH2]|nr:hypothetical protein [Myxococcaceae bacterium JPH2]